MTKTVKSSVRLFGRGEAASTLETIETPEGPMLPGPEYDAYKRLQDFHDGIASLVADIQTLRINREQAIQRIDALPYPSSILTDIEQGLQKLKAGLEGIGETGSALVQLGHGLPVLRFGVSGLASSVPRPLDPNTVQPLPRQSLGSGSRWRDL